MVRRVRYVFNVSIKTVKAPSNGRDVYDRVCVRMDFGLI